MTFRKEDLLPYREIRFEKTPEYLKTVLMQWTTLQYECGGFVTKTDSKSLSNMFSLDKETSDTDGFLYAPADFSSVFEQVVKDNERDDQRLIARQDQLKTIIIMLFQPSNVALHQQVEKLIIDELMETNILKSKWISANLRSKAVCLAGFRIRERDGDLNPTKPTFRVHLNRLIGDHGLNMTLTTLTFSYETTFYEFEKILQDETQLCYIDPDISVPPVSSVATVATPSASIPAVSMSLNPLPAATVVASPPTTFTATFSIPTTYTSEISTYSEFGTTWVKRVQSPSRVEKGYTCKDGPWRCRIGANQGTTANQRPIIVGDKESYATLVSMIKDYNKRHPTNEHFLVIMHSKERTIWEKAMNEKEQIGRELRQRKQTLTADDVEEEDALEETYYEWLCRTKRI